MKPILPVILVAALLAGCDGNPFTDGTGGNNGAPTGTTGTGNTAASAIDRREEKNASNGNGYASSFTLNPNGDPDSTDDDTFTVDGLAFDGGNEYQRGTVLADLGPFKVYESDSTYEDTVTGAPIDQFLHRAIYGVSDSGKTNFAVVRTGAYTNYGFGGFVYKRSGGVTIPDSGQASYNGRYAALRDFQNAGGLEYATGNMNISFDFADFNDGAAVAGTVSNRAIYDIDGNDITQNVLDAIDTDINKGVAAGDETYLEALPVLRFNVGPGVVKSSGEIAGGLSSTYKKGGADTQFEKGNYYALLADNGSLAAGEIVGIIVVEGNDLRYEGVTFRETGGFILAR